MSEKIKVLFVDDEEKFLLSTAKRLAIRGLEVDSFTNGTDAIRAVENQRYDVALLDLKMPGMDGEELLKILKELRPNLEVVIITGHGSFGSAVTCTRKGAYGYLQKPCELDDVILAISNAFASRVSKKEKAKAERVEELMKLAVGYSPIQLLEEIHRIDAED